MRLRLTVCLATMKKVTITTEAVSYNKIFCYRNFYITDETGQQIMLFKTTYALMDYETRM